MRQDSTPRPEVKSFVRLAKLARSSFVEIAGGPGEAVILGLIFAWILGGFATLARLALGAGPALWCAVPAAAMLLLAACGAWEWIERGLER